MAIFSERTAHSVNHMFSLLCLFVVLVVSHLGFKGGNLVLIAPVPGQCFPFPFEPCREKTGLRGFRPGPTQTRLYNHTCDISLFRR